MARTYARPVEVLRAIEALASETRLRMLGLLASEGPMTAAELARALDLSLPTVLEHMAKLEGAGLVTWTVVRRGGREARVYRPVAGRITVVVDLRRMAGVPPLRELERLAAEYLEKCRRLGRTVAVADVRSTLGVDEATAEAVAEYLNGTESIIVRHVADRIRGEAPDGAAVRDLARRLNVDEYWVVMAAKALEDGGAYRLVGDRLVRVSEE